MPKTKDAFAFRDFNEQRLMFRIHPLLREVEKEIKTDDDYNADDAPLDADFFKAFATIAKSMTTATMKDNKAFGQHMLYIASEFLRYSDRIVRHIKRLRQILTLFEDKISSDDKNEKLHTQYRRAKFLISNYAHCLSSATIFAENFLKSVKGFKEKIATLYRQLFAERLKQSRQEKKITQAQMANKLGITVGAYQFYELARREPNITRLIQISTILDVTPNFLLGFE